MRLLLKAKGSHECDLRSLGIPNQMYRWDVDLALTVVPAVSSAASKH